MPRSVPLIRGLREIASDYDALIVDLWGVIHGGVEPYPGVLETLAALRAAGKPVGLLSNAPRRSRMVAKRLAEIGVPAEAYDRLVTSGEAAHDALAARSGAHAELGRRYFYLGPQWDTDLVDGLDYLRVDAVEEADFLLTVGLFDEADPLSAYDPLFAEARERDLVMVCVNPDLVVHRQSGVTSPCAGLLAQHYEGQGGRVIYHGKPDPARVPSLRRGAGREPRRCARAGGRRQPDHRHQGRRRRRLRQPLGHARHLCRRTGHRARRRARSGKGPGGLRAPRPLADRRDRRLPLVGVASLPRADPWRYGRRSEIFFHGPADAEHQGCRDRSLARRLARVTGEFITQAVRTAVEERLEREERHRGRPSIEHLMAIARRCATGR